MESPSNIDYKQKYLKALQLATSYYSENHNAFLDTLFPELKPSRERVDLLKDIIITALIDCTSVGTGIYFTAAEQRQALRELATE